MRPAWRSGPGFGPGTRRPGSLCQGPVRFEGRVGGGSGSRGPLASQRAWAAKAAAGPVERFGAHLPGDARRRGSRRLSRRGSCFPAPRGRVRCSPPAFSLLARFAPRARRSSPSACGTPCTVIWPSGRISK
eukprot:15438489-Alexandrium_andersonii.AAC.1